MLLNFDQLKTIEDDWWRSSNLTFTFSIYIFSILIKEVLLKFLKSKTTYEIHSRLFLDHISIIWRKIKNYNFYSIIWIRKYVFTTFIFKNTFAIILINHIPNVYPVQYILNRDMCIVHILTGKLEYLHSELDIWCYYLSLTKYEQAYATYSEE